MKLKTQWAKPSRKYIFVDVTNWPLKTLEESKFLDVRMINNIYYGIILYFE